MSIPLSPPKPTASLTLSKTVILSHLSCSRDKSWCGGLSSMRYSSCRSKTSRSPSHCSHHRPMAQAWHFVGAASTSTSASTSASSSTPRDIHNDLNNSTTQAALEIPPVSRHAGAARFRTILQPAQWSVTVAPQLPDHALGRSTKRRQPLSPTRY
jgi:hypothetical protein